MLAKITIKLTSPFLGSGKPDENNIRHIIKDHVTKNPVFFTRAFLQFCKRIAKDLCIAGYDNTAIIPSKYFITNSPTQIINIKYFKDNQPTNTKFEVYPRGAILSFTCLIDESKITVNQLELLLNNVGSYSGVSQFGKKNQFGGFIVHEITKEEIPIIYNI